VHLRDVLSVLRQVKPLRRCEPVFHRLCDELDPFARNGAPQADDAVAPEGLDFLVADVAHGLQ
jgi:hypothetical protein